MYLKDLEAFRCYAGMSRNLQSGDIVFGQRTSTSEPECAVVLGFAGKTLTDIM